ncbi:MAG: hypothetical protein M3Q39_16815 [Actinomycetota bacterium]|nr:hypothetical protein [Actinomycetota bacterium]
MSLGFTTDATQRASCDACGAEVAQREVVAVPSYERSWRAEKHLAPCGAPCIGGGIGSDVLRAARLRGKMAADVVHGAVHAGSPTCPNGCDFEVGR